MNARARVRRSHPRSRTALGCALAIVLVASCSGQQSARPPGTTAGTAGVGSLPGTSSTDGTSLEGFPSDPPQKTDHDVNLHPAVAPNLTGWVEAGPPLRDAEVRLVDAAGTVLAGPTTTDENGFFLLDVDQVPRDARVLATGGTLEGATLEPEPFEGTLAALVERAPDGRDAPTTVTVATTLQVAHLDAEPAATPEVAAAETRFDLAIEIDDFDLGADVAAIDEIGVQQAFVEQAKAKGGFDAYVVATSTRTTRDTPVVVPPTGLFGSLTASGLAKSAAGAIASTIIGAATDSVIRNLGYDESYNRLLELAAKLDAIQGTLKTLTYSAEAQARAIQANEYLKALRDLDLAYLDSVDSASKALGQVADAGAGLELARAADGDVPAAQRYLDVALDEFNKQCANTNFLAIPGALADNFRSPDSILGRYIDVVMKGQRYVETQDSTGLQTFFNMYHAYQLLALRIATECVTYAKGPAYADAAIKYVWEGPYVHAAGKRGTDIMQLPRIVPPPIPADMMIDVKTDLLWLNDTVVGISPFQDRVYNGKIPTSLTGMTERGPRTFDLAAQEEVTGLVDLGAPKPVARINRSSQNPTPTFPTNLFVYLSEIGLAKVAVRSATTGQSGALWTSTLAAPIQGCYAPHVNTVCNTRPVPNFGNRARVVLSPDASVRFWPGWCNRGGCFDTQPTTPAKVCTHLRALSVCREASYIGWYRAGGIYRSALTEQDRYLKLNTDLTPT